MNERYLANKAVLINGINNYFNFIEGEYHLENKPFKESNDRPAPAQKVWDREPGPATFSGLALHLGFKSLRAFDNYIENGEFSGTLKWGRLRIEAFYEQKLHAQSASGAIFALKNMGWNKQNEIKQPAGQGPKTMQIEVLITGPPPAENEKEVIL